MYKALEQSIRSSEKHAEISDFAYRVWTQGLAMSDIVGRLTASPRKFHAEAIPLLPENEEKLLAAFKELEDSRLVHFYEVEGKRYMVFHDHEEYNKGTKNLKYQHRSKLPPPPPSLCFCVTYTREEEKTVTADTSADVTADSSASVHVHVPVHVLTSSEIDSKAIAKDLVDLWNVGKPDKEWLRSTPKRVAKTAARLKDGFTREQLHIAVSNCLKSEWHQGANDRGWRAPGPEWVLHTTERLEEWVNRPQQVEKSFAEVMKGWSNG